MPDINITVIRPKKVQGTSPEADIVYPTLLDEEEDELSLVEMTLYDYATFQQDGEWYAVEGWNNDDLTSVLWTATKDFIEQYKKPFHLAPRTTTWSVRGNVDSRVRGSVIEREFAATNDDRWDRKPLMSRPAEWRSDGNRWYAGGTYIWINPGSGASEAKSDFSAFNIKVELTSAPDTDALYSIDPDSFHDGKAQRLKMKYAQMAGEIQPCVYRGHIAGRKLGVKITDQSKSFGHYIQNGLGYTYDWIDGIYFCPFDTTDDTNFKVTVEPSFAADAVSGKMVVPGKWDIGLIPRRWLYYARFHHQQNPKTDYEDWIYGTLGAECQQYFPHGEPAWVDNQAVKIDWSVPGVDFRVWKNVSTHHVVSFWGRFPPNFTPQWGHDPAYPQVEDTSPVTFFDANGSLVGTSNLIWSETYSQAQAHFIDAGGTSGDAAKILTGGLSCNLHVCSDSSDYCIKVGDGSNQHNGTLAQIACTSYGGPVVTRSADSNQYLGYTPALENENFGVHALWDVIENSAVWENIIEPLRTSSVSHSGTNSAASRIDMIPFGVAVSPSKTGDLVGVIRQRGKGYFVWRKTDEEITPKTIGNTTNPIRFESCKADGELDHFFEGNYKADANTDSDDNVYDGDYCDLFVGDSARKLTHVGRDVNAVQDLPSESCGILYATIAEGGDTGAVKLDTPAFVMVSKEHALNLDWPNMWQDESYNGTNFALMGRLARTNGFAFQTQARRNSY